MKLLAVLTFLSLTCLAYSACWFQPEVKLAKIKDVKRLEFTENWDNKKVKKFYKKCVKGKRFRNYDSCEEFTCSAGAQQKLVNISMCNFYEGRCANNGCQYDADGNVVACVGK